MKGWTHQLPASSPRFTVPLRNPRQMSSTASPAAFGALFNQIRALPTVPGGVSDTKSSFDIDVREQYMDTTISRVIAVCTKSDELEGGVLRVSYHFRLFCDMGNNASVELQTYRLSSTTGICKIFAKERPYVYTSKNLISEHFMPSAADSTLTVKQVMEYVIHEKKRYQYIFDRETGSGCRYWCNVVVQDMEDLGLLPVGSAPGIEAWGDEVAKLDPEWMPEKAVEGKFY